MSTMDEGTRRRGAPRGQEKISVLVEMRPALEGFAGIPQEVRLLFRGLRSIEGVEVEGMVQTSHRVLARGTRAPGWTGRPMSAARRVNRYSRVIVSMAEKPFRTPLDKVSDFFEKRSTVLKLLLQTYLGFGRIRLTRFESKSFEDFTWRTFFSKTLSAADFDLVATANHRICTVPWNTMHSAGLATLSMSPQPKYPLLDLEGADIFIGQTPYPARVSRGTTMVIRYHDAIPVFMPHTIPDKSLHQATHFYALAANVRSGAWFACVSEATRQDLIKMFPEAEPRAVTIHNVVAPVYFDEDSKRERVPQIIRSRLYEDSGLLPKFLTLREKEGFYRKALDFGGQKYLLMVSTIEPRKNHARLLAAWEVLKAEVDPDLKLVIVGTLGWDYKAIVSAFKAWIDRGQLFMLTAVPAPDLRVLYKHAAATICPSLGEGFDFSGVEAMSSGGVTIASDIPVHREIYEDAAEYFDPYATRSLVDAIRKVLYDDGASGVSAKMRDRGREVAGAYTPERLLPKWEQFLRMLTDRARGTP